MTQSKNFQSSDRTGALWARFRFSVVGALLSAPHSRGELVTILHELAAKTWTHPITGREVRFAFATIERWYYRARRERDDPVRVLRRTPRKDRGRVSLPPAMAARLAEQYSSHSHWSYQLHYDNLAVQAKADPSLGPLKSYCTVRRYMQAQGLVRKRRERPKAGPGERRAAERREQREIRSYEAEYAGSLWHLDFHHGSLQVLTASGQWRRPIVLGVLDDYSRLCCHLQWYLSETTEDLVHGFSQAIQKRGLGSRASRSGRSADRNRVGRRLPARSHGQRGWTASTGRSGCRELNDYEGIATQLRTATPSQADSHGVLRDGKASSLSAEATRCVVR